MRYKQALSIGNSDGTIQCTFATIYDQKGNKVFALQRRNFGNSTFASDLEKSDGGVQSFGKSQGDYIVTYTGDGKEGIMGWDGGNVLTGDTATGYITFDMPLVTAKEWSGSELVPVQLLFPAIEYIKRTLLSAQKIQIPTFYRYKNDEDLAAAQALLEKGDMLFADSAEEYTEDKRKAREWNKNSIPYLVAYRTGKNPIWEELESRLNENEIFYVKPAAFDWMPTNLANCTDKDGVAWNDRVKVCKEKLDRAKALLIASGATVIF